MIALLSAECGNELVLGTGSSTDWFNRMQQSFYSTSDVYAFLV